MSIVVYNDTTKTVSIGTKNLVGWLSSTDVAAGDTWTYDTRDFWGNSLNTNVYFIVGGQEIFAPLVKAGKHNLTKLADTCSGYCSQDKLKKCIRELKSK